MDHEKSFQQFKKLCESNGLLKDTATCSGEDVKLGIQDDGTLMRFFRARGYNVYNAYQQYKTTRDWRDKNDLIKLYDSIDVSHYEETRKLHTHWIGRRDRNGSPICWFEISHLTPSVMSVYSESCSSTVRDTPHTETEEMLRLFCTYENLVRFVLPLCSTIKSRPAPEKPVTDTTCIVDISNVGLLQFWRLKNHMQAASSLATAHYPETLGKTYVIGAPSFFPIVWSYINRWFDQNTVNKICIVPSGQERETLSELIDPSNIPKKYGGEFDFEFGMTPDLDLEIQASMDWLDKEGDEVVQDIPKGPMRWTESEDGRRTAIAVGTESGVPRNRPIMAVRP